MSSVLGTRNLQPINSVRVEMLRLTRNITEVKAQLSGLSEKMDPSAGSTKTDNSVPLQELSTRATELEKRVKELSDNAKVNELATRTAALELRSSNTSASNSAVDELKAKTSEIESKFSGMAEKTALDELTSRAAALEGRINAVLSELINKILAIEQAINNLQPLGQRIDASEARAAEVAGALEVLRARFDGLDAKLSGVDTRILEVDNKFSSNLGVLSSQLEDVKKTASQPSISAEKVASLENMIVRVNTSLSLTIENLTKQVTDLAARVH